MVLCLIIAYNFFLYAVRNRLRLKKRTVNIIALDKIYATFNDSFQLSACFNSLRKYNDIPYLCMGNKVPNDILPADITVTTTDNRTVNLNQIRVQGDKGIFAVIAASKMPEIICCIKMYRLLSI